MNAHGIPQSVPPLGPTAGSRVRTPSVERHGPWDPLLLFTGIFMVLAVARIHLLFPGLEAARPVLVAGALSVGFYLLDRHPARSLLALASPATLLLFAFLVWMAAGTPFALRQGATFSFVVDDFSRTVALFAVVAGCARSLRDVERLAWLYFVGAVAYASVVLSRFEIGGDLERLADLYTYDANDFALLVVTAVPFGLYFVFRRDRSTLLRMAEGAGILVLLTGFVWSGSRGGFLALLAAATLFLVRFRSIPVSWRMAGGTLAAVVVVSVAGPQYWDRMGTMAEPQEDYNITSPTGRWQVWQRGVGYMLDRPVFGLGASNFAAAEGTISPRAHLQEFGIGVRWSAPHNSFLQVGAETGVPGLLLFLGFLLALFAGLGRVRRSAHRPRGPPAPQAALAEAIIVSLGGFLVGAFFLSHAYSEMLYVLAAFAVGLDKLSHEGQVGRRSGGPPRGNALTPARRPPRSREPAAVDPRSPVAGGGAPPR